MLPQPMSKPTPEMRDLLLIGDHAADRLGVAEMAVRADHAGHDIADRHAVAHLRDGRMLVLPKTCSGAFLKRSSCGRSMRDLRRGRIGLARKMLLAGGVAIQAPGRLAAAFADAESGSMPRRGRVRGRAPGGDQVVALYWLLLNLDQPRALPRGVRDRSWPSSTRPRAGNENPPERLAREGP